MTIRSLPFAAAALASVLVTSFAAAATPPRVTSISSLDDLTVPEHPFNPGRDADADVSAAFAQARAEHKLVLIDLGANWCADCRILAGILELPEVRAFDEAHYVTVNVDIGRLNRNMDIPARFGVADDLHAVPSILIADPDGTLVNRGHTQAIEDTRAMTPQAIADWLAEWTP